MAWIKAQWKAFRGLIRARSQRDRQASWRRSWGWLVFGLLAASGLAWAEPAAVVTMIDQLKFQPAKVTVNVGETVEWHNQSLLVHTVTADPEEANKPEHVHLPTAAETFNSGKINPQEKFRYTFEAPGTYRYFCIPHEATGMRGTVEVRP